MIEFCQMNKPMRVLIKQLAQQELTCPTTKTLEFSINWISHNKIFARSMTLYNSKFLQTITNDLVYLNWVFFLNYTEQEILCSKITTQPNVTQLTYYNF